MKQRCEGNLAQDGEDHSPGDYTPFPPLGPTLLTLVRQLRREQTSAEGLLWALLRNRQVMGLKFRRQHPIGPYVLDFYCVEAHLGIELDGGQHDVIEVIESDQERTAYLEARGIKVIRFWNHEVLRTTEVVLQTLCIISSQSLTRQSPSPQPSPSRAREPEPSPGSARGSEAPNSTSGSEASPRGAREPESSPDSAREPEPSSGSAREPEPPSTASGSEPSPEGRGQGEG
ncbi:MAG: endonuclease domain-containing protein [Anaerolineae bacterium]